MCVCDTDNCASVSKIMIKVDFLPDISIFHLKLLHVCK